MIWFTADQHYNHKEIIKFCNRPFKTVEEMNETIIKNHNAVVGKYDVVWHLGDFAWDNAAETLGRLKGIHKLCLGNHDKKHLARWEFDLFDQIFEVTNVRWYGVKIWCSHYAHSRWPSSHHGRGHAFAHSHGMYQPKDRRIDVGVDNQNFTPICFQDLNEQLMNRPVYILEPLFEEAAKFGEEGEDDDLD